MDVFQFSASLVLEFSAELVVPFPCHQPHFWLVLEFWKMRPLGLLPGYLFCFKPKIMAGDERV